MAGMLYSLIALGFVLIYKACGVFNFAQGAMVLFAALAMARFAEWIPQLVRLRQQAARQRAGLRRAGAGDDRGGLADRAAGAAPAGQPGRHHAADGHAGHRLLPRRLRARRCSAATSTRSTSACRRTRSSCSRTTFQGGVLLNKEDLYAAVIAAALVALLALFFQKTAHRPRAARGGRRPPGRAVDRHPAEPHLGHRLVASPASSRWSPASSGAASWACSSRSRWWR